LYYNKQWQSRLSQRATLGLLVFLRCGSIQPVHCKKSAVTRRKYLSEGHISDIGIQYMIPSRGRDFIFATTSRPALGACPASYSMGTQAKVASAWK